MTYVRTYAIINTEDKTKTAERQEVIKMTTFTVTVNHGAIATKETERTFFVEAASKQEAYQKAKINLLSCGNDGYEYVVEIEEA